MRSKTTREFRRLLDALPDHVQDQTQKAYRLFHDNPQHPGLQLKRVNHDEPAVLSAKIGLHYRALGVDRGNYILWFWIGTHTDYERLLNRL